MNLFQKRCFRCFKKRRDKQAASLKGGKVVKKIKCIIYCLCVLIVFLSPCFSATALNQDYNKNSSPKYVFISQSPNVTSGKLVYKTQNQYINSNEFTDSSIAIVDYDELSNNPQMIEITKELLLNGKYLYIRAKGYSANQTLIEALYNIGETGDIIHNSPTDLMNRINTTGYLTYVDIYGNLQCVRFLIYEYQPAVTKTDALQLEQKMGRSSLVTNITLDLEIELLEKSKDDSSFQPNDGIQSTYSDVSPQDFAGGKSHYNKVYDRINMYAFGELWGGVTRRLCAYRLEPATSNISGPPTPAAGSTATTRWAWQAISTMSPGYETYGARNYECNMALVTWPTGVNNATYKQVLLDYTPSQSLENKNNVTCSLGSSDANISFTANFKDVSINPLDYASGPNTECNAYSVRYDIRSLNPYIASGAAKNVLDVPIGVITQNTGNKNACIQLNSSWTFAHYDGWYPGYSRLTSEEQYLAWALPVR